MRADLKKFGLSAFLTLSILCVEASFPADKQDHPDGFWFGTQSLLCMTSKSVGPLSRLIRRERSTASEATPLRSSLRYIHRLLFYRDTVFEWGAGVRGYYWGLAASVTDCPVTWEPSPAGQSHCPIEAVINFTRQYRNGFGPYHLVTNNCHHFTNHVSALLSDPDCGSTSRNRRVDHGIISMVERSIWKAISFVLSYVAPLKTETQHLSPQETEIIVH